MKAVAEYGKIYKNKSISGDYYMNILFYLVPKSEVMYLYDDFSLRQALEKMEYHKYSAVPIINKAGNYVGTLT